jgi:hypothetical protein
VERTGDIAYADGRVAQETLRFLVLHSSQLAQQQSTAYSTAQTKEVEWVADHIRRAEAQHFACVANTKVVRAEYEGRGQDRRGRGCASGVIILCAIGMQRPPNAKNVRAGDGLPRARHPKMRPAIACGSTRNPSNERLRSRGGRC